MGSFSVIEPVVDLRREPEEDLPGEVGDHLRETQLLFNEEVLVKERREDWLLVEAVEQRVFRKSGIWEGYPGWVPARTVRPRETRENTRTATVKSRNAPILSVPSEVGDPLIMVSLGTRLIVEPDGNGEDAFCPVLLEGTTRGWVRRDLISLEPSVPGRGPSGEEIVDTARLFLGTPYLWGGRSMHVPGSGSIGRGVDCSGLINLVFRVHWVDIPRDAHEQSMVAESIERAALAPGDLIFIADQESIVRHVMLYTGGENLIEAPETGGVVRESGFRERLGVDCAPLGSGSGAVHGRTVSFGRVVPWPRI